MLADFAADGVSSGGTEAINLVIENPQARARLPELTDHRLRNLLAAEGSRPYRERPNHA